MQIPFIRLDRQFSSIHDEMMEAVEKVFRHGRVLQGPEVAAFEGRLAALYEQPHAVAVNSGTDALILSLRALGLPPNARVAVPSLTFVSSASAIVHNGGVPVFVDIDNYYMADRGALFDLIENQTVDAIIAVDLYGQLMELEEVAAAARQRGIFVIEDGAQSVGAKRYGHPAGRFADVTCLSFDPLKVLGAQGSGGAVLTSDPELAERLRRLRYHGHIGRRVYAEVGFNSQLASIQAAILMIKLDYLDVWNAQRVSIAQEYTRQLLPAEVVRVPGVMEHNEHTFHKFVLGVPGRRDELAAHLKACGVETSVHYELPLHKQPCFEGISETHGRLNNTEAAAQELLSLPIYPELTDEEVNYVCQQVLSFPW